MSDKAGRGQGRFLCRTKTTKNWPRMAVDQRRLKESFSFPISVYPRDSAANSGLSLIALRQSLAVLLPSKTPPASIAAAFLKLSTMRALKIVYNRRHR